MSNYIMMIWDTENITTPALGDLFRVMGIEADVLEMNGSLSTHVGLEPYVGDKQLAQCREEMQKQSDEVQAYWLSPVEAEGLRRQLAKAQIQAATPKEAAVQLWGFYDGNTLIAKPGYEDAIHEAWDELLIAVDTIAGDALLEQLATLDAAEAALAASGIGGIYAEFDCLADAIAQMSEHIKEAELAEHVNGKAADELAQTVVAERQLRLKAEQRATSMRFGRDSWRTAWENVTAELAKTHEHLAEAEQRATRAEALVTLKLAELLERLGTAGQVKPSDKGYALTLAARIREALGVTE